MSAHKLNGPGGIWLEIDDQDEATPALVCGRLDGVEYSSTYDCAMGTGFIEDEIELTRGMVSWLESEADTVEEAFETARKDSPNYR
jgi:hypothetical protein